MAAFYIARNERAMITSHRCVNLVLASAIKQIQSGEVEWKLNTQNGTETMVLPPLTEYLLKPIELNHICWYEYLEMYQIVNNAYGVDMGHFKLHDDHPSKNKKVVIRRKCPVVVQYHGYSLKPSARRDTPEKKEIFAFCVLVMFKPYTCISDIRGNYVSYYSALFDINGHLKMSILSPIGYEVIQNSEDRWRNKFASEASGKEYRERMNDAARSIEDSLCPVMHSHHDNEQMFEFVSGDMDISTQNFVDIISLPEADVNASNVTSRLVCSYVDQTNSINVAGLNEKAISAGYKSAIHSSREKSIFEKMRILDVIEVRPLIDSAINTYDVESSVDYNTIRKKYLMCNEEFVSCRVSDEKPSVMVPVFASLREVCDIFTLTDSDQRRAFVIGAVAFLSSYIDDGSITTDCVKENQVFGVIQGLAGSGKSYVVNAWTALAMSWGRDTAVQCVAITGIAASSLGGKTIASVLAMKNSFSADMLATKLLVIDEVRYCIIVINNILGLIYFLRYRFIWLRDQFCQLLKIYSEEI